MSVIDANNQVDFIDISTITADIKNSILTVYFKPPLSMATWKYTYIYEYSYDNLYSSVSCDDNFTRVVKVH
jgi:hypothetical protein